jgi:hypothetical protein
MLWASRGAKYGAHTSREGPANEPCRVSKGVQEDISGPKIRIATGPDVVGMVGV